MGRLMSNALAICGVIVAVFVQRMSAHTVHVVGGDMGWTIPQGGAPAYSAWASTQKFVVGDILTFNFATNAHNVVQVPKASFDSCSKENAVADPINIGPANVTLNATGDLYFICSFGTHCQQGGQKLAINVSASASAGPSPSPTPGEPTALSPPQPAPSDSSSPLVFAALLVSLFSIAVGGFFSL